jgi:hypothetical protein
MSTRMAGACPPCTNKVFAAPAIWVVTLTESNRGRSIRRGCLLVDVELNVD